MTREDEIMTYMKSLGFSDEDDLTVSPVPGGLVVFAGLEAAVDEGGGFVSAILIIRDQEKMDAVLAQAGVEARDLVTFRAKTLGLDLSYLQEEIDTRKVLGDFPKVD